MDQKTKEKKPKVKGARKRTEAIAQSRRDLKLRGEWRPGEELLRSGMRIMGNRVIYSARHTRHEPIQ